MQTDGRLLDVGPDRRHRNEQRDASSDVVREVKRRLGPSRERRNDRGHAAHEGLRIRFLELGIGKPVGDLPVAGGRALARERRPVRRHLHPRARAHGGCPRFDRREVRHGDSARRGVADGLRAVAIRAFLDHPSAGVPVDFRFSPGLRIPRPVSVPRQYVSVDRPVAFAAVHLDRQARRPFDGYVFGIPVDESRGLDPRHRQFPGDRLL